MIARRFPRTSFRRPAAVRRLSVRRLVLRRSALRRLALTGLSLATLLSAAAPAVGGVECDRTKQYTLNKNHGPYMIMVAAIHPLRGGNTEGLTPAEAADQVVYDLRSQGIPAYTYTVDTATQTLSTRGRNGEEKRMVMATAKGGVCVLACNFKSADDDRTTQALEMIKTEVKCRTLEPVAANGAYTRTAGGGFFQRTQGRNRSPLSRAFVTVNPLLDAAQVRKLRKIHDPLLAKLNGGEEYSLHRCPGQYSVMIKEFRGRTLTQVSGTKSADVADRVSVSGDLNDAKRQAWELCQILRNRENQEAYVWHDRHRSVVTIGSFGSAKDPAAVRTARRWAAKFSTDGKLTPETISVPKMNPARPPTKAEIRKAKRFWMLEVAPYAMPVPNM